MTGCYYGHTAGYTMTGSNTAWSAWTNASTATTYSMEVWYAWNATGTMTTTGATYANQVWGAWNTPVFVSAYDPTPLTAAQRAERDARQEQARLDQVERARKRDDADRRARVLLESFLDEGQKTELAESGRFHVVGSRGRRYCIRAEGQSGNVYLLDEKGGTQARLCVHPAQAHDSGYLLPDGDALLMQKMELENDEDFVLRTANVVFGHRPALEPVAA